MSLHRRNPKRDSNEAIIVAALEARGFHVDRVSAAGFPDLVVTKHGAVWFIEVKARKGRYTAPQIAWRAKWTGPAPHCLRTVEDALAFPHELCNPPPVVQPTKDANER